MKICVVGRSMTFCGIGTWIFNFRLLELLVCCVVCFAFFCHFVVSSGNAGRFEDLGESGDGIDEGGGEKKQFYGEEGKVY